MDGYALTIFINNDRLFWRDNAPISKEDECIQFDTRLDRKGKVSFIGPTSLNGLQIHCSQATYTQGLIFMPLHEGVNFFCFEHLGVDLGGSFDQLPIKSYHHLPGTNKIKVATVNPKSSSAVERERLRQKYQQLDKIEIWVRHLFIAVKKGNTVEIYYKKNRHLFKNSS